MGDHEEKIYFQSDEVLVSDKRVILPGKTYALKLITSVGRVDDKEGPKTIFFKRREILKGLNFAEIGFGCVGGWFVFNILASILAGLVGAIIAAVFSFLGTIAFVGALAVLVFWFFCPKATRYWVEIGSASGKELAVFWDSQEDAKEVSDAIEAAIIDN